MGLMSSFFLLCHFLKEILELILFFKGKWLSIGWEGVRGTTLRYLLLTPTAGGLLWFVLSWWVPQYILPASQKGNRKVGALVRTLSWPILCRQHCPIPLSCVSSVISPPLIVSVPLFIKWGAVLTHHSPLSRSETFSETLRKYTSLSV